MNKPPIIGTRLTNGLMGRQWQNGLSCLNNGYCIIAASRRVSFRTKETAGILDGLTIRCGRPRGLGDLQSIVLEGGS
ncbi:MAG: hypothetical protein KAV87_53745 [Desulfobacteraceae bacterium]|nr:hypothetical protein [Desulfobacteraceae bacterium]